MTDKICVITTVHSHNDVRIYHKQAAFLASEGYQVVVLCPDYTGTDENGVRFRPIPLPKKRINRILVGSRAALPMALEEKAGLYLLHDPELLPLGLALRRRGRQVFYDAHEDLGRQLRDKPWLPALFRPTVARAADWWLHRKMVRLSGVLGATPEIARELGGVPFCNFPSREDLPDSVYHSFPPYRQRPAQGAYVGAITETRGIFPMIEGARQAGLTLRLAGKWESQELILQAHREPGWKAVTYDGLLDRAQVYQLLGNCRMGLLLLAPTAAYRHSMPIKLFEYLLAGLPVVASDFPFWRQLAGDCCLYVPPNRPEEIADAIRWLLEHPDEAQAMGERGRQLVLERWLLEGEQQRLLRLVRMRMGEEAKE